MHIKYFLHNHSSPANRHNCKHSFHIAAMLWNHTIHSLWLENLVVSAKLAAVLWYSVQYKLSINKRDTKYY